MKTGMCRDMCRAYNVKVSAILLSQVCIRSWQFCESPPLSALRDKSLERCLNEEIFVLKLISDLMILWMPVTIFFNAICCADLFRWNFADGAMLRTCCPHFPKVGEDIHDAQCHMDLVKSLSWKTSTTFWMGPKLGRHSRVCSTAQHVCTDRNCFVRFEKKVSQHPYWFTVHTVHTRISFCQWYLFAGFPARFHLHLER